METDELRRHLAAAREMRDCCPLCGRPRSDAIRLCGRCDFLYGDKPEEEVWRYPEQGVQLLLPGYVDCILADSRNH